MRCMLPAGNTQLMMERETSSSTTHTQSRNPPDMQPADCCDGPTRRTKLALYPRSVIIPRMVRPDMERLVFLLRMLVHS